tara:strand:- start:673 stop:1719 length:1047 start_codon:yes stop_codon:yes gene_type:complete
MVQQLQIDLEKIRKNVSLLVCTPMYGGQASGLYTKSTNDLAALSASYGIKLRFYYLFNESLITRARNYCVDEFLRSDSTHLMFIDADIGFNAKDLIAMIHIMLEREEEMDVLTGPYPKKSISWEKIKAAVEQGYADENPFLLDNFVGDYVFNPVRNEKTKQVSFRLDEPVEVNEAGTGFMLIPRKTFEKYEKAFPEYHYLPDHVRTEAFDGSREIMAYFDCIIDPKSKRYLSEDYMFCQNLRDIGLKIWMCPWIELKHVGSYIFGGSLSALASIKASPTASHESNKKFYDEKKKGLLNLGNVDNKDSEVVPILGNPLTQPTDNKTRADKRRQLAAERKRMKKNQKRKA